MNTFDLNQEIFKKAMALYYEYKSVSNALKSGGIGEIDRSELVRPLISRASKAWESACQDLKYGQIQACLPPLSDAIAWLAAGSQILHSDMPYSNQPHAKRSLLFNENVHNLLNLAEEMVERLGEEETADHKRTQENSRLSDLLPIWQAVLLIVETVIENVTEPIHDRLPADWYSDEAAKWRDYKGEAHSRLARWHMNKAAVEQVKADELERFLPNS